MADFEIYAPLSEFYWKGDRLVVGPGIELIRRPPQPYPLRDLEEYLTTFDKRELFLADHWLRLDWSEGEKPSPGELVNLFLVALWIAKPTKTHVKFRFEVATDTEKPPGRMSRLYDQFQWVEDAVTDEVTDAELTEASSYFQLLRSTRLSGGRLASALFLTSAGCQASWWSVALVCYAAATEAILTYETGPGVTKRLACAYACLVETSKVERDQAFNELCHLYGKRSDVMHGRGYTIPEGQRLTTLARFGDLLRALWKAVILSPSHTQALEGDDSQRKVFFERLQDGYRPPAT